MFKTAAGSALAIVLALGSFPLAQAASLSGSVTGEAAAAADAVSAAAGSANVSGETDVSAGDVSASSNLDASVSTDTNLTNTASNLTSGAYVNSEADLTAYTQTLLSSERSGGSASASGQTDAPANVSGDASGAVSGSAEGSADAAGSVKGAYVSDVAYANDAMTVSFRQPARFLGFIPTTVDVDATVSSTGEVSLHYPWYSFLMATHRTEIMAALEARIASIMNGMDLGGAASGDIALNATDAASSSADASASASMSPRVRAQILDEVRSVVHEIQADGSLAADATGTASF